MPRKTIETESPHSEDDEELKVYEPDSACGVCDDRNDNEPKVINCRSTQGWCSTTPRLGGACGSSCADLRCGRGLRAPSVALLEGQNGMGKMLVDEHGGINADDEVFTFNTIEVYGHKKYKVTQT